MQLKWRQATEADLPLLGEWNRQLIRDEGHSNRSTLEELVERMRGWLQTEYRAVILFDHEPVGYAVYRQDRDLIYLRQFLVRPERRRQGVGKAAIEVLKKEVWPSGLRLTVDVLCQNHRAIAFWRNVGYRDYCLTLEIPAARDADGA